LDETGATKATLVTAEIAQDQMRETVEKAGLSPLGRLIAEIGAYLKMQGWTSEEWEFEAFESFSNSVDSFEEIPKAIAEIKRAELWPWKGVN